MECNKDEAVRAKQVAEQKLLEKDISGAKKFALKAQNLYPKLEGLSQFLEIIDVYAAYERKINGELDYYGIFGVDALANEEVLKKQYKRMALSLHPDKNKSVGADGAFKILSQAWSVLSDSNQRTVYNSKLNIRAANHAAGIFSSSSAMYASPANSFGFSDRPTKQGTSTSQWYSSTPRNATYGANRAQVPKPNPTISRNARPVPSYQHSPSGTTGHFVPPSIPHFHQQQDTYTRQPVKPHPQCPETFWTMCKRCCSYFEFGINYMNQNILCLHCRMPFSATEMARPKVNYTSVFGGPRASTAKPASDNRRPKRNGPEMTEKTKRAYGVSMKNNRVIPEQMKEETTYNDVNGMKKREKIVKKRRKDLDSAGDEAPGRRPGAKKASAKLNRNFEANWESKSVKELSQAEIRAMLARKARMEIRGLLSEWEAEEPKASCVKDEQTKDAFNHVKAEKSGDDLFKDPKNTVQTEKSPSLDEPDDMDTNPDETVSMMVPDANFHNFDDDRIEDSFSENQVWAAYDNDDGMPRYYALVQRVLSRKPFKMQISWLNSRSCSEFGSLDWIGSGFTKTSGDYRAGKCEVNKRLNSFSHPVKWKKGPRGVIQVFPTKGDVWAVYRNWSPDWVDQDIKDEIIHKYDVVVVLEECSENGGVVVARLVKVGGFTSVFNLDKRETHMIPREEMFRFSHQVPFYILSGLEAENLPKDCYELDPAALPLELLKMIADAEAAEEQVSEAVSEAKLESANVGNQKERDVDGVKTIMTYSRRKKRKENEKAR
ncbi:DNAJ heat shock N-terminal domain-containing protein [Striga hermonthica]|uniref:DNAJ heat shock N-terminal domain-containing protein n=1 Tax=Striga hermonthica TaxID=68872 RepID=A0A9N7R1R2_STRHE|nr:DNAJ heat shock N-terminal domain-containing protein [Striga hermonthica]